MTGRRYRYRSWHGGADPLADPLDVRHALDALGDRVMEGEGVRDALRDLLRRGFEEPDGTRRPGMDELRARAQRMRREALRRGRLDGVLTRAAQQLDQALAEERDALAARTDDDARFNEARLDALPHSTAQAVRELTDYRWASPEAEQRYRQILEELRSDVLDQQFRGLRDALSRQNQGDDGGGGADDGEGAGDQALKDMLGDLNDLLAKHARGDDTQADFDSFMQQHGQFFPEEPENVEELIDSLARRAAAAARLMASLSPQQREELQELMSQALGDADLARELAALGDNLRGLRPDLTWNRGERTTGDQPLGYGAAAQALQEISELDDVLGQLGQGSGRSSSMLDDVDVETVERALGRGAADDARRLAEIERELQRQGWLTRDGDRLVLSPKALRRLGQTALSRVFAQIAEGRRGDHDQAEAGAAGEPTGASRPWVFGDEQPIDVVRTVRRAVLRAAGSGAARSAGAGGPSGGGKPTGAGSDRPGSIGAVLPLDPTDFEVVETENRASASVALCVDLSYSMYADDRWAPMKQTALALASLMATRFPQDALQLIGFGLYAETLTLPQLAGVEPTMEKGTNLQHALALSQRHLRRHPDGEPVVLVVTDGEPTAHLDGGVAEFWWPPTRETVRATVGEVDALTKYGARINVFMLGDDPGLRRFMDAVAQRNGGRVFTPSPDRLGEYVVSDYLRARNGGRNRATG
jgi:uncharacterized protein with von Willebrand factor type A (vWA) domain